jgi:hypothetical protein
LSASVLYPAITATQIGWITADCGAAGLGALGYALAARRHAQATATVPATVPGQAGR